MKGANSNALFTVDLLLTMDGEGDGVLVLGILGPQPVDHRAGQRVRGKED